MPEANEQALEQPSEAAEPQGTADEPQGEIDWKAMSRMHEKREKEYKAQAEKNQAAADKLAELEEASKTELQKATERADSLQKQLDELRQAQERASKVAEIAKAKGVDAEILAAMSGDIEENAELLASRMKSASYPAVYDGGENRTAITATATSPDKAFAEWLKSKR